MKFDIIYKLLTETHDTTKAKKTLDKYQRALTRLILATRRANKKMHENRLDKNAEHEFKVADMKYKHQASQYAEFLKNNAGFIRNNPDLAVQCVEFAKRWEKPDSED